LKALTAKSNDNKAAKAMDDAAATEEARKQVAAVLAAESDSEEVSCKLQMKHLICYVYLF